MAKIQGGSIRQPGIRVDPVVKGDPELASASNERRFAAATKVNEIGVGLQNNRQKAEDDDFVRTAQAETELEIINKLAQINEDFIDNPSDIPEAFDNAMQPFLDDRANKARTPALAKSTSSTLDGLFQRYRVRTAVDSNNKEVQRLSNNLKNNISLSQEVVKQLSPNDSGVNDLLRIIDENGLAISRADYLPSSNRAVLNDKTPGELTATFMKSAIAQSVESGKELLKDPRIVEHLNPIQVAGFQSEIARFEKANQLANKGLVDSMVADEVAVINAGGAPNPSFLTEIESLGGTKAAADAFKKRQKAIDTVEVTKGLALLPASEQETQLKKQQLGIARSEAPARAQELLNIGRTAQKKLQEDLRQNGFEYILKHSPNIKTLDQAKALQRELGKSSPDVMSNADVLDFLAQLDSGNIPLEKVQVFKDLQNKFRSESGDPVGENFGLAMEQLIRDDKVDGEYRQGIEFLGDPVATQTFVKAAEFSAEELKSNATSVNSDFDFAELETQINEAMSSYRESYSADHQRNALDLVELTDVMEKMAMTDIINGSSMEVAVKKATKPILDRVAIELMDGQAVAMPSTLDKKIIDSRAVKNFAALERSNVMFDIDDLEIPQDFIAKFGKDAKEQFGKTLEDYKWVTVEGGKTMTLQNGLSTLKYAAPKFLVGKDGALEDFDPNLVGPETDTIESEPEIIKIDISEASDLGQFLGGDELEAADRIGFRTGAPGVPLVSKINRQIEESIKSKSIPALEGLKTLVTRKSTVFSIQSRKKTISKINKAINAIKKIEEGK